MGRAFGARGGRGHGDDTSGEENRETRECFSEKSFVCGTSNVERPTSNVQRRIQS